MEWVGGGLWEGRGKGRSGRGKRGGEPQTSKSQGRPMESRRVPSENKGIEFAEVTLEADPETVEAEKAAAWAQAGINRVSFGVQSFAGKELMGAGGGDPPGGIIFGVSERCGAGLREEDVVL